MDDKQREKYLKVIMFQTDWVRQELRRYFEYLSDSVVEKLLRSAYQNDHTLISIRSGEARSKDRKSMVFVEAMDLNHRYLTYRMDFLNQGETIEMMREIRRGWKPVSIGW